MDKLAKFMNYLCLSIWIVLLLVDVRDFAKPSVLIVDTIFLSVFLYYTTWEIK